MSNISDLSRLSFFKVSKYAYQNQYICDFRGIPRPHYCMGLILEGMGEFSFNDRKITVQKGDIIFVPVGSTYISAWTGSPDVLYISTHFSFELHGLFPRNHKLDIQKITLPETALLQDLYTSMYQNSEGFEGKLFSALSAFYQILGLVYPHLKYTASPKTDPRIEAAVRFIELHYRDSISVEELAKLSNMSVSHFHACFKDYVGCSPIEYKNRSSIRHAELLLLDDPKRSVEEISDTVGFASAIYFRETFKRITGQTPTQYRRQSEATERPVR